MKGSNIPELHLSTLTSLIEKTPAPVSMVLSNKFPTSNAPSDTIEWESRYGSAGMIPFVARGSRGPSFGDDGVGKHSAKAAYFQSEKFYGEEFLNNLREPGTTQTKRMGATEVARTAVKMINSARRRREWMFSQALFEGTMSYSLKATSSAPTFASVSWGIPTSHQVTLGSSAEWYGDSGEITARNIFGDIAAMKNRLQYSLEMDVSDIEVYINPLLVETMLQDSVIRGLIKNANISDSQVNANQAGAIAELFGIGRLIPYGNSYTVESPLAQAYTSGTTIYVVDPSDFVVGGEVYIKNTVHGPAGARAKITAVNQATGAITLSTALTGYTGIAYKSQLAMNKYFLSPNKVVGVVPSVDGQPIAEMMQAPYGLPTTYGVRMRSIDSDHPEGTTQVIEDLCLPVMYYPAAVYQLTVGDTF